MPLSVNNFYQAIAAAFFLIIVSFLFEIPFINFDKRFILSMGWQIIMVSFGAYAILMYLIKNGTASKTSNFGISSSLIFVISPYKFLSSKLSLYTSIAFTVNVFEVPVID